MNDETTIILVRHGQTEWNKENRLQGHKNSPLTEQGKQQAITVKTAINLSQVSCAYVSPLLRAKETLNIITNNTSIKTIELNDLKEINLGPWEGKTKEATEHSHPLEFHQFWHKQDDFCLNGAENFVQLQNKMVRALKGILERKKNKTVLVVSHWIAIKVATAFFMDIPIAQLNMLQNINNGSFITLKNHHGEASITLS